MVSSAAAITGVDMEIAGESAWVHAFVPVEESDGRTEVPAIEVPVSEGRAPVGPREIALGAITMREAGREIGETIEIGSVADGATYEMEIVGTTIVNDTFEASPGRGAAVAPAFIAEAAPELTPDPIVVRAAPGVSVDELADAFAEVHQGAILEPRPQGAVCNVSRIRNLPFLMTVFVVVLALASLVHALVLATNRNRRALGMLKGLGFVRREVAGHRHLPRHRVRASARWSWRCPSASSSGAGAGGPWRTSSACLRSRSSRRSPSPAWRSPRSSSPTWPPPTPRGAPPACPPPRPSGGSSGAVSGSRDSWWARRAGGSRGGRRSRW